MRGDPPQSRFVLSYLFQSTPHARGSTARTHFANRLSYVYPACAGIHRLVLPNTRHGLRLPRMRGDPPFTSNACIIM